MAESGPDAAAQAAHRGEKMRASREKASAELQTLRRTVMRVNQQRTQQFMELARTHTTATEIEKQKQLRQHRLTSITLELAGDLDEHGEAELRKSVDALESKRVGVRRDVLATMGREKYLWVGDRRLPAPCPLPHRRMCLFAQKKRGRQA